MTHEYDDEPKTDGHIHWTCEYCGRETVFPDVHICPVLVEDRQKREKKDETTP